MSDIDFDELDRAVNSLITSQPIPEVNIPGMPKEKVLNISTPRAQPESRPATPSPVAGTVPTPPVSPLIERRSGGQFMDVVHPSSNMRTAPLIMPDRATRQQSVVTQNNRTMAPDVNIPPMSSQTQPTAPSTDISPANPNPNMQSQPADATQDSPFITDAKVEKRPLGAFSADMPASMNETPAPVQAASTAPDPVPAPTALSKETDAVVPGTSNEGISKSTVNVEAPLPAELQSDLLLIESGNATNVDETMSDDNMATAATVAATSSINQQYAEKPSTGDKGNGAIFDTKSYHKASISPAKKKPGWMWVLWVSLLLIVGAGAGAAVYWFVLK